MTVDLDKYCVKCDSEIGTSLGNREDWCWLCNEPRYELPDTIRDIISGLEKELEIALKLAAI